MYTYRTKAVQFNFLGQSMISKFRRGLKKNTYDNDYKIVSVIY